MRLRLRAVMCSVICVTIGTTTAFSQGRARRPLARVDIDAIARLVLLELGDRILAARMRR